MRSMSRKAKIIIVISAAVVVLLALCAHVSFHWTKEMTSCNSTTTSSWSGTHEDRLRILHTIAIVAPRAKSADVRLGDLIADKLKEKLSSKPLARDVRRGDHSWTSRNPEVTVYQSAAAANRAKADFYLTIEPKQYRYSFWPFARNWNAKVSVYGSPAGVHTGPMLVEGSNDGFIDIGMEFDYSGRIIGIFTPSYLTSKVAEEIAKKVVDEIEQKADTLVNEFLNRKKED